MKMAVVGSLGVGGRFSMHDGKKPLYYIESINKVERSVRVMRIASDSFAGTLSLGTFVYTPTKKACPFGGNK
jgi:hypothetical protein